VCVCVHIYSRVWTDEEVYAWRRLVSTLLIMNARPRDREDRNTEQGETGERRKETWV